MDKALIIAKLREHEPELKAAGVEHLFLHGSYARGTALRELSDVDLIAEFDTAREYSLLDRVRLENRLPTCWGEGGPCPGDDAEGRRPRTHSTRGRACLLGIRTDHFRILLK